MSKMKTWLMEMEELVDEAVNAGRETWREVALYVCNEVNYPCSRIDLEYCKTIEFYPSLVVHGPLIAQQLVQIADEKLNGDLKKFEFKALNPIFVKEKFSIHLIEKDDCLDLWISDKSGNISMKAKAT